MRPILYLILIFLVGCANPQDDHKKVLKDSFQVISKADSSVIKPRDSIFSPVNAFPNIRDTTGFIDSLKNFLQLDDDALCAFTGDKEYKERISYYKKIRINGSDRDHILCEYDFGSGCMVAFPWKLQFLFTPEGKLVASFQAVRFELIRIFPKQDPFLLTLVVSGKGNGGHHLYKIVADTVENIYDGYKNYEQQTYDIHEDLKIYEPDELKLSLKDFNGDGHRDLVFSGKMVLIRGMTKDSFWYDYLIDGKDTIHYDVENPFKKLPIRYVSLYDPVTGHFVLSNKYNIDYDF